MRTKIRAPKRPEYNYMVSYLENGVRVKFYVKATKKPGAIEKAEADGAKTGIKKNVQLLTKELKY